MNWKRQACRLRVVVLLAAALLSARGVRAQGLYYREVVHEGRVYVFNLASEYEAWAKTRRVSHAITRESYGPKGEAVVFDSAGAISLYNFKHDKPGERLEAQQKGTSVSWRDGETTIQLERAEINISNRIQVRWTEQMPDGATQLPGTSAPGQNLGSFRIRRAKFKIEGWVFEKDVRYALQLNWPGLASATPGTAFEDAYIDWDVSKREAFRVRAGLFRVPFGRQQMTSSANLQFVERSIVSSEFGGSRDTGALLWGELGGGNFEWRAGVFNGNGPGFTANDNNKYQYNARVMWQPNGRIGYSESDFESKDTPLFALGADVQRDDLSNTTNPLRTVRSLGADLAFKYKGLSLFAEYFDRRADPRTGARVKSNGYQAQAGMLLGGARRWEVALRYAAWDASRSLPGDTRSERGAAFSYYYARHHMKLQTDVRRLKGPGEAREDEVRVQTQFMF